MIKDGKKSTEFRKEEQNTNRIWSPRKKNSENFPPFSQQPNRNEIIKRKMESLLKKKEEKRQRREEK